MLSAGGLIPRSRLKLGADVVGGVPRPPIGQPLEIGAHLPTHRTSMVTVDATKAMLRFFHQCQGSMHLNSDFPPNAWRIGRVVRRLRLRSNDHRRGISERCSRTSSGWRMTRAPVSRREDTDRDTIGRCRPIITCGVVDRGPKRGEVSAACRHHTGIGMHGCPPSSAGSRHGPTETIPAATTRREHQTSDSPASPAARARLIEWDPDQPRDTAGHPNNTRPDHEQDRGSRR